MEHRKSRRVLNEPEFPTLTRVQELEIDVELLARCLSKIKYFFPIIKEKLNDSDLAVIEKHAP